jgi:colicin import membrane protein
MKILSTVFFVSVATMVSAAEIDPGIATQFNTRLQEMMNTTGWSFSKAIDTKQIFSEWQSNQARAQIKYSKPGIYYGRISKIATDNFGVNLIIDQGKSTAVTVILENNQVWPWNASDNQLKIGGIQSSLEFAANVDPGQEMYFQCRRVQFGLGVYLTNCLAFPPSVAASKISPEVSTNVDADISLDDLIRERASEGWSRPPSARKNMQVTLQIGLLADGTITSVDVVNSSGDKPFDNSAVDAVKNIGELPEVKTMKSGDINNHQLFNMEFTPNDLAL